MKRFTSAIAVALATALLSVALAAGATYVTNTTPGNTPSWLNPGWNFTATSDTAFGESVCVEVHPQGDGGNYIRTQCGYVSGSAPTVLWTCNVFTGGVPSAFQSKTVEYQFFVADSGTSCNTNTEAFTGFNWTFTTTSNAVSLSSFAARQSADGLAMAAAALVGLSGLAVSAVWRRR